MQPKLTRLEYLKQTIAELNDDPSRPWSDYPCIEWPFAKTGSGYGAVTIQNRLFGAHRIAFIEHYGPVPEDHDVGRHCLSKSCFRPVHLFPEPDQLAYAGRFAIAELAANLDVSAPCSEWPFMRNENGYGVISQKGKWYRASRVVYEVAFGSLGDLHVLHSCDNPPCVRLAHLSKGTPMDNCQDKMNKGRLPKGEDHCRALITEADVREIFRLSETGISQAELARRFGFRSSVSILAILRRRTWAHVKID